MTESRTGIWWLAMELLRGQRVLLENEARKWGDPNGQIKPQLSRIDALLKVADEVTHREEGKKP